MNKKLLNEEYINDLREVINRTNIFFEDEVEKSKFNLVCAIMDRFDTSVKYINEHNYQPKNDEEVILLMIHLCIIKDGINIVAKELNIQLLQTEYFRDTCCKIFEIKNEEYNGDDKFFEYFRSLIFAHPFVTNRSIPKAINKNEIQYSPYILENITMKLYNENDTIGSMVYSNSRDMFAVSISTDLIKKFIRDKYNCIIKIIESFNSIIEKKENEWKKRKVNRHLNSIDILKDVVDILKERYIEEVSYVEKLVEYLECESSISNNDYEVDCFKKRIVKIIPNICNCVDEMDYEEMCNVIENLYRRPKKTYAMQYYQLEKIFCYLNDNAHGDIEWGLKQAKAFSKEFAKKYVKIDVNEMSFSEIKMLVEIACFREWQEQNKE